MDWAIIGNFILLIIGLAVLIKGSDWLVDSGEKIGLSLGISPFIIGVTIVAAGTSLPELAAAISAVNQGVSEVVISTVVGSNIANILLVISLTVLLGREIFLEKEDIGVNIPLLFGSAFLLWFAILGDFCGSLKC